MPLERKVFTDLGLILTSKKIIPTFSILMIGGQQCACLLFQSPTWFSKASAKSESLVGHYASFLHVSLFHINGIGLNSPVSNLLHFVCRPG